MREISKYTLMSALAFVAITGNKKGLHMQTRLALHDYTRLNPDFGKAGWQPMYSLTDEGRELARQSRMWKAHEHLIKMGFTLRKRGRQTTRHLSYVQYDDHGERWAHTGSHGSVYAAMEKHRDGNWAYKTEKVAEFRNGIEKEAA